MDQSIINSSDFTQESVVAPEPLKKSYKWLIIAVIAFFISVIGLGFFAYKYWQLKQQFVQVQPSPTSSVAVIPSADPTANWKTYKNFQYLYQLQYPDNTFLITVDESKTRLFQAMGYSFEVEVEQSTNTLENWLKEKQKNGSYFEPDWIVTKSNFQNFPAIFLQSQGMMQATMNIYVVKNKNNIYKIAYSKEKADQEVSNQILSTFKFTENQLAAAQKQKRFGYIKSITGGRDNYLISFDPAEFIEDNSQPNGYRINNLDSQAIELQTDVLGSEPKVIMQTYSHGPDGNFNFNQQISFGEFLDAFNNRSEIKNVPYWVETYTTTVTKISEQYLP